ncbi:MAG: glutamate synthase large subunit [Deltaproteobacteria bacterium]|nr:glutamate synthase large subunit [Deltaproteobacteria bacterium]
MTLSPAAARSFEIAEHDACGVALCAELAAGPSRRVVQSALTALGRMAHRGGVAADGSTGDGAGLQLAMPDALLRAVAAEIGVVLPPLGHYAVAVAFLARDPVVAAQQRALVEAELRRVGARPLAWRPVPIGHDALGAHAREVMPTIEQLFVATSAAAELADPDARDAALWLARKRIERAGRALRQRLDLPEHDALYLPSLSARTVVYKGLGLPGAMDRVFPDLADPRCTSTIALSHTRFSTNTLPAWRRAHPYRLVAHNGEINTIRGNAERMAARRGALANLHALGLRDALAPVLDPEGTDSAMLDEAAELLVRSGRSLAEAMRMLLQPARPTVAEAGEDDPGALLGAWHAGIIEPWDGPALAVFSDGQSAGAALDRNGLRPARWLRTHDGLFVLASEIGVVDVEAAALHSVGRLGPGELLLLEPGAARPLLDVGEVDARLAAANAGPGGDLLARIEARDVPLDVLAVPKETPEQAEVPAAARRRAAALLAGWTEEDVHRVVLPMAQTGHEPIGAMGDDTPLASLAKLPQPIGRRLRQAFAQVTNPPIDPIREALVMRTESRLGDEGDLSDPTRPGRAIVLPSPLLQHDDWARLQACRLPGLRAVRLPTTLAVVPADGDALQAALQRLARDAVEAVHDGAGLLLLDDRETDAGRTNTAATPLPALPALLATSAVHHALVDAGLRSRAGLAVRTAECRDVMDLCLLVGFGASAVRPWLLDAQIAAGCAAGLLDPRPQQALANAHAALVAGMRKVLSKMGISTVESYRGAKLFEAIGVEPEFAARWLPGVPCRLGGMDADAVAAGLRERTAAAAVSAADDAATLPPGGLLRWHRDGEAKAWDPQAIGMLQHAARSGSRKAFTAFSERVDAARRGPGLRAGLGLRRDREPVPLDEVESVGSIVTRFRTGAMSFGSLSREAHETLAVAMNRLGGRSNSGEGGEDLGREQLGKDGSDRRSAIRQVASGRFGVHGPYLAGARELQIKMAQGAKPGEGGHLPGHKVDATIAEVRCSTPGVGLVSPPPHHDIYSIEDLAQLIDDLRAANDQAEISVKLVSRAGVGTIAAGVAKAGADHITISCGSGGTGAAPLSSIRSAGAPWELGIVEAQRALGRLGLRDRVRLEIDGQLKTGRDVVLAALLGAERYAFGTAALVATGCVLMRVCHLNTCPVGVATQDPALRARFPGEPDHVVNFLQFVAEEVREHLAALGLRSLDEAIGRADLLAPRQDAEPAAAAAAADLLAVACEDDPAAAAEGSRRGLRMAPRPDPRPLQTRLQQAVQAGLEKPRHRFGKVALREIIGNEDRSVGTRVSAAIARRHGRRGLPAGSVRIALQGAAGQSFGAFLAPGVDLELEGFANDGVGKGMWGGRIAIRPPQGATLVADRHRRAPALAGNALLYGATGGELFVAGAVGERFGVRNSGAVAVVEGCGDHGAEYMTRGELLLLGPVGRNFGAGMSGGVAWVWDPRGQLARLADPRAVRLETPTAEDEQRIRELLLCHRRLTGSPLAFRLLRDFALVRRQFARVMPRELHALLEQQAEAQAEQARVRRDREAG